MAGFLKTEENRRLAVSAGSAAVVYILLFLFFAVYFAVGRREPQSFGASAVYLNLTQVSQAAVREEGANPSSGSSAKQSASTQSASTQSASTQSLQRSRLPLLRNVRCKRFLKRHDPIRLRPNRRRQL